MKVAPPTAARSAGGSAQQGGSARVAGPHRRTTATDDRPCSCTTAFTNWVVPSMAAAMAEGSEGVAGGSGG